MFEHIIKKVKCDVEDEINRLFEVKSCPQEKIYEAMRYSMTAGGKRIRPVLFLKTYEMIKKSDYFDVLKFAISIEMIHTYSLIHDDLPAMDDDDFRRGKPTNHREYGEDMAILAGDGLLNLAYENMIEESIKAQSEDREKHLFAIREIGNASGVEGMIGGQVVDIISTSEDQSLEKLDYIHKKKTSRLIEASIVSGAILAGASEKEIETLQSYAEDIGLMFQIRDDILDKIGDSELTGKTVGIDDINDKLTYVSVHGIDRSIEKTRELYNRSLESLETLEGYDTEFLKDMSEFLIYRKL